MEKSSTLDIFNEAREGFDDALHAAVKVSETRLYVYHSGRQNRVLMSFAKTIAHAMSVQSIYSLSLECERPVRFLDHFSVATLTRSIVDGSLMTLYLSEPTLTASEWDLRRQLLFLHNTNNRKRFLEAMYKSKGQKISKEENQEYIAARDKLLSAIISRCNELNFTSDRIDELKKGQTVYIDGARGAVREARLDVHEYDFLQSYLSNHVHSHPVSLLRTSNVSFDKPTEFQIGFVGLCLEAACKYLSTATERVDEFTGAIERDPNGHID